MSWLMEGDPAIRWQAQRDLFDKADAVWTTERDRVGDSGWGLSLLEQQGSDGIWSGGLYNPKWTSTTYSLLLLYRLGLAPGHPAALTGCQALLDGGAMSDGGIDFSRTTKHSETCITGMVTAISSWFGVDNDRVEAMVDYLLTEQMPDGGWNCLRWKGATHSSFHTTISALEGLAEYCRPQPQAGASPSLPRHEKQGNQRQPAESVSPTLGTLERHSYRPQREEAILAGARGREFLLNHRLYKSHRTGAVVDSRMTRFSFPPRWYYDVLRSLDHFQAVSAEPDTRADDAIALVLARQRSDGRWPLQNTHRGKVFFDLETGGEPSRWNTLRALRVLRWWDGGDRKPRRG